MEKRDKVKVYSEGNNGMNGKVKLQWGIGRQGRRGNM